MRRQSVWDLPIQRNPTYNQLPNGAGLRSGNCEKGLSPSIVSHRAPTKLFAKFSRRMNLGRAGLHHSNRVVAD